MKMLKGNKSVKYTCDGDKVKSISSQRNKE